MPLTQTRSERFSGTDFYVQSSITGESKGFFIRPMILPSHSRQITVVHHRHYLATIAPVLHIRSRPPKKTSTATLALDRPPKRMDHHKV